MSEAKIYQTFEEWFKDDCLNNKNRGLARDIPFEAFNAGKASADEKIKELEAQIALMKCCANCSDYTDIDGAIKCHERLQCNNYDAWKIKE